MVLTNAAACTLITCPAGVGPVPSMLLAPLHWQCGSYCTHSRTAEQNFIRHKRACARNRAHAHMHAHFATANVDALR